MLVNRQERIQIALAQHGLDAFLALTPENAEYLSGRHNYIASHWNVPGLAAAAVGSDGRLAVVTGDFGVDPIAQPSYAVLTYQIWTESIDVRGVPGATIDERVRAARGHVVARPKQYRPRDVLNRVRDALHAVCAAPRAIGVDLKRLPTAPRLGLKRRLPGVRLVDASAIFDELRWTKDADEIDFLRLAAELTEAGIAGATARLDAGMTETAVNAAYQIAVHERVLADPRVAAFRQAEGLASVGFGDQPKVVALGRTVKFDMQVDVGGYHSDIGRTFAIRPTDDQRRIYDALRLALMAAQEQVRPGATFADVWRTGAVAMGKAGFTNYSRGHLGHSVGLAHYFEEPPFFAPGEHRELRPGMVLSLELPYYVYGVGAFQLERMLLVTEDGHEALDRLPFAFAID